MLSSEDLAIILSRMQVGPKLAYNLLVDHARGLLAHAAELEALTWRGSCNKQVGRSSSRRGPGKRLCDCAAVNDKRAWLGTSIKGLLSQAAGGIAWQLQEAFH